MKNLTTPSTRLPLGTRVRSAIAGRLEVLAEAVAFGLSISGAAVAVVLGKLIVGAVLAGLALGFLVRLKHRKAPSSPVQQKMPTTTVRLVAGVISACEVAALVEATNLPVRFSQEAFHMGHWYLVLLAFFAAYFLQLPLLTRIFGKRGASSAA